MREKAIEQKLRLAVKSKGGLALKFTSPGTSGVPDRIVFTPNGKVYFIELKATGKKMTPRQLKMSAVLEGLGHKVRVIDSMEKVKAFLDEICSA